MHNYPTTLVREIAFGRFLFIYIINDEYCGEKLKDDLCRLARFRPEDLVSYDVYGIYENKSLPANLPKLKISEVNGAGIGRKNIQFSICNRADLRAENYVQLENNIKVYMASKNKEITDGTYYRQLKKNLEDMNFTFYRMI